ncbi:glycosyl hydrolase 108 family protein [Roseibium sp. MMSF_3412]|uniref:glycosyl hydrolase 108 family protein n=1 Tax=Roseibium sp. MMSF_3412 TaxID=3046712 RepID=UPI00273F01E5|nr:glycosyl hydrolase 108 family protein [Roseibium sp. MMSF_3412]
MQEKHCFVRNIQIFLQNLAGVSPVLVMLIATKGAQLPISILNILPGAVERCRQKVQSGFTSKIRLHAAASKALNFGNIFLISQIKYVENKMSNTASRSSDVSVLHPAIRSKVIAIQKKLHEEKIPFEVFEAFRTPERQAILYDKRPRVTWVGPWGSIHQYGLAVDFVLRIDGEWSWDDSGKNAGLWARMHELALENGMTPLYNKNGELLEKPHIQLIGVSSSDLRKGNYPAGGDEAWAEHLSDLIDNWSGDFAPPKKPKILQEPPPLPLGAVPEMDDSFVHETPEASNASVNDPQFKKLHEFVKRWEGDFVNHPSDPGGATNMGITISTLTEWRGTEVTVDDVKKLSRAEADQIFRTRYYASNRCGEMPERMAMVIYNCSVLSGRKRAITLAQEAFNGLGLLVGGVPLIVDGILGRMTMSALKGTDASLFADAFMDRQEEYLRQLNTFSTFGKGWLNRMGALREFVNTLQKGAGARPARQMTVTENNRDLGTLIDQLATSESSNSREVLQKLLLEQLRSNDRAATEKSISAKLRALFRGSGNEGENSANLLSDAAAIISTGPDGKPPLTPINAALGQVIGRVLNGKKSIIGLIGLSLTTLLPQTALTGDIVSFVSGHQEVFLTLFSVITGWGMFGKMDKAIRLMGLISELKH